MAALGSSDGIPDGELVTSNATGEPDGVLVGLTDSRTEVKPEGTADGATDGRPEGKSEGTPDGELEKAALGSFDGIAYGELVTADAKGDVNGFSLGTTDGI